MRISAVLLCLWIICLNASLAQSRGWRGLVPLYSTRSEVERLLGQPNEQISKYSVFYRTPKETVIIQFANGLPCGIGEKYSQWSVSRDTVESILVTPLRTFPLSELGLTESKYQKRSGGHRAEDIYYINEEDGESIRVFQGEVMEMSFYPGTKDAHLSCSGSRSMPATECDGLTPPTFDSYGNISLKKEERLLDNFSIALLDEENRVGYIIAYAGKREHAGEAKELAERAKNYLVKVRNFPADRLKAINGGYREERQVELYVVPGKTCPPIPAPTVDPRDVQTRPRKLRKNRPPA